MIDGSLEGRIERGKKPYNRRIDSNQASKYPQRDRSVRKYTCNPEALRFQPLKQASAQNEQHGAPEPFRARILPFVATCYLVYGGGRQRGKPGALPGYRSGRERCFFRRLPVFPAAHRPTSHSKSLKSLKQQRCAFWVWAVACLARLPHARGHGACLQTGSPDAPCFCSMLTRSQLID